MKIHIKLIFLFVCSFTLINITHSQIQIGENIDGEFDGDWAGGGSVSFSSDGNRVAIGASTNDFNGLSSGHVRVFELVNDNWILIGNPINGEEEGDRSGYSVSLSSTGNRLAIGSIGNGGTTRIFEFENNNWTQIGAPIEGEESMDQAGHSISLSADGHRIAIGANWNNGNGNAAGQVRLFELIDETWTQIGQDLDGEAAGNQFGYSVSLSSDGNKVAIGAHRNGGNGIDAGQVSVFELIGDNWTQMGSKIEGTSAGDHAGFSVSLSSSGNKVAVGAIGNDANGEATGQVRIYEWLDNSWAQIGGNIDGKAAGDRFGWSISLSANGNKIAIGADSNDDNGFGSGQVKIFELVGSNWIQLGVNINGEAMGDQFGYSIAISPDGNKLAVGALSNNNGFNAGQVKIYGINGLTSIANISSPENEIEVFPNPVSTSFQISGINEGTITIMDCFGKRVKTMDFNNSPIDISNLMNGAYFIQIITKNQVLIKKIMVL